MTKNPLRIVCTVTCIILLCGCERHIVKQGTIVGKDSVEEYYWISTGKVTVITKSGYSYHIEVSGIDEITGKTEIVDKNIGIEEYNKYNIGDVYSENAILPIQ